MADTVAIKTIFSASNRKILSLTSTSDGTGETNVRKVVIASLTGAPTRVWINRVQYSINGGSVQVSFDHTTPDVVLILANTNKMHFEEYGGLRDPGSAGGTGDIFVSTVGTVANDTYTIILDIGW